jgi:formiminotetrahydrofolate cyclodeaminase
MIKDQPISQFLDELASDAPTPGGGGAAAIMGAMGGALTSMVCNLTVGKKNYAEVEGEMKTALDKAEDLRTRLVEMIKADVDVFDKVMGAYGLPKDTDEEKTARSAAIQVALKEAADVPLACAKLCREVIDVSRPVAEKGNKNVISDSGVSVLAAYAALKSAALNVYINVGGIKDEEFAQDRLQQLEKLLDGCEEETNAIYEIVKSRL